MSSKPKPALYLALTLLSIGVLITFGIYANLYLNHFRITKALPKIPDLAAEIPALQLALANANADAREQGHAVADIAKLGSLYHANGFTSQALTCWLMLSKIDQTNAKWPYLAAQAYRTVGDDSQAFPLLATAARLEPNYAPVWLKLADYQFKNGSASEAAASYQARLQLIPNDPYSELGLARLEIQANKPDKARARLAKLAQTAPSFSAGLNLYAELLEQKGETKNAAIMRQRGDNAGRFREAEDPWTDSLLDSCYDPYPLLVRGSAMFLSNYGDGGESLIKRAIELDPTDPRAYSQLGKLYCKSKDGARARDILELALEKTEPNEDVYYNLVEAYSLLGQHQRAIQMAKTGLRSLPESAQLYNVLGLVYETINRADDALQAYQSAFSLSPNDPSPANAIAAIYYRLGQKTEAKHYAETALARRPLYEKALALLATILLEEGDLETSRAHFETLYQTNPESPSTQGMLALWYATAAKNATNTTEAIALCRQGLEALPQSATLHETLGRLQLATGSIDAGLASLQNAVELEPTNHSRSAYLAATYLENGQTLRARQTLQIALSLANRQGDKTSALKLNNFLSKIPQ